MNLQEQVKSVIKHYEQLGGKFSTCKICKLLKQAEVPQVTGPSISSMMYCQCKKTNREFIK